MKTQISNRLPPSDGQFLQPILQWKQIGAACGLIRKKQLAGCYNTNAMRVDDEDYFLDPPPGSAAARAVEFGIDLTLTLENLRLTPEERIRKLDQFIIAVTGLKASARRLDSRDAADNQNN